MERKCRLCKSGVSQGAYYCNQCAYKKGACAGVRLTGHGGVGGTESDSVLPRGRPGICSMCGKKVLNTKQFKMSS